MNGVTKRWNGKTQDERRAERRDLLIAAAIDLYGSNGFRNTGVRAICQGAGLTERYFYESFANGDELLLAAFERVVDVMRHHIGETDDRALSPDARVESMLIAYFTTLEAHRQATRVFLIEIVGVSSEIDRAFEQSLYELSSPILTVYDPDGTGPLSRDVFLHRGVAGGLLHIALAWSAEDYSTPVENIVGSALTLCRLASSPQGQAQR